MRVYTYRMPWGDTLRVKADLSRAESPIMYQHPRTGEWVLSPFQTADARHRKEDALRLVVGTLGAEWYADPSSKVSHDDQMKAAIEGSEEVSQADETTETS